MHSLNHEQLINLITCAQARASEALEATAGGDWARINGEGLTVATYSQRLAGLWADFSRRELPY